MKRTRALDVSLLMSDDTGTIIAYFPAADIQSLKKGDMVTADLAMKDNGPASRSTKDSGATTTPSMSSTPKK